MLVPLFAIDPGTFEYDFGSTEQMEKLAWVALKNLKNLEVAGYQFTVDENVTITPAEALTEYSASMNTWITGSFAPWLGEVFAVRANNMMAVEDPDNYTTQGLPALVSALPALLTGAGILPLIAQVVLKVGFTLVIEWLKGKVTHDPSTDFSEMTDVLKNAFLRGGSPILADILHNFCIEIEPKGGSLRVYINEVVED